MDTREINELSLDKIMLQVLADYDLRHTQAPITFEDSAARGLLLPDEAIIWISNRQGYINKIEAIIHECLHGYYDMHKINRNERQVNAETQELMRRLGLYAVHQTRR